MTLQSSCPRCRTLVSYEPGTQPTCPACGYPGPDVRAQRAPTQAWTADAWSAPAQAPAARQPPRTSGKAVTAMILGIAGIVIYPLSFLFGIAALVLGVVARKEILASDGAVAGNGMAVAGIVLGIIGTLVMVLIALVVFVLVADLGAAQAAVLLPGS